MGDIILKVNNKNLLNKKRLSFTIIISLPFIYPQKHKKIIIVLKLSTSNYLQYQLTLNDQ